MSRIGDGCPIGGGVVPEFAFPSPTVDGNEDHRLEIRDGGPESTVAFLLGTQPTGGIALFGCSLEILADVAAVTVTTSTSGVGRIDLPVPATTAGATLYAQGLVLDPEAPNGAFGATPGWRVAIGD